MPVAHAAQVRSAAAVATALVYEPGAHGALTAKQVLPSFTPEYAVPGSQAAHLRSLVDEPCATRPWPTGHVAHTAQLSVAIVVLVVALKEPKAHSTQVRSLLAEAATAVRKPGPHGALTATHLAPLSTAEKVEPAMHAAH